MLFAFQVNVSRSKYTKYAIHINKNDLSINCFIMHKYAIKVNSG